MAQEIPVEGYQDIRDYIEANWTHVELRDSDSAVWARLVIATDSRVSWTHDPSAQTLELTIELKGDDADIDVAEDGAQEFAESALLKGAVGGDDMSVNTFTPVTLADPDDELVVKHRVQVPIVE